MKKTNKSAAASPDPAGDLRQRLARKVAFCSGSGEIVITQVPGLRLSRRTAPTAPASCTYEPSLAVVAQGRKRTELAGTPFIFDPSRYLLTSLVSAHRSGQIAIRQHPQFLRPCLGHLCLHPLVQHSRTPRMDLLS